MIQLGTILLLAPALAFPFPHTVLSVEENRQWEKSHMVSPVLAGWLRPEAAVICRGTQTQIYPTGPSCQQILPRTSFTASLALTMK